MSSPSPPSRPLAAAASAWSSGLRSEKHVAQAARLKRFVERAGHVVTLFKPFTENSWRFYTDSHVTLLTDATLTAEDLAEFDIDMSHVVWPRYLDNFCYGLRRWVLHEDVVPIAQTAQALTPPTNMALSTNRLVRWDADHHKISFPSLFQDITWAYTSSRRPGYTSKGILGRLMGVTGWRCVFQGAATILSFLIANFEGEHFALINHMGLLSNRVLSSSRPVSQSISQSK